MMNKEYIEYLRSADKLDALAADMYGLGSTTEEIAEALNTSRQQVHNMVDRHTAKLEKLAQQMLYLEKRKPGRKSEESSNKETK
jgi:predicted DNA-binding protein YlxM (UPF0122 family)